MESGEVSTGPEAGQSAATVVDLFADATARAIMAATADQPRSVNELIDECRIPTATAYRKVNSLVEAGILAERRCIRPQGVNYSEYVLQVEEIQVSISDDGVPTVSFDANPSDEATSDHQRTDGTLPTDRRPHDAAAATSHSPGGAEHAGLGQLFVDVTGRETVRERRTHRGVRSERRSRRNERSRSD